MERVLEPELMTDPHQAEAYAAADFAEANDLFVAQVGQLGPLREVQTVVDLGCGPGDICLELADRYPRWRFHLVDGAPAMLDWARRRWARASRSRPCVFHEERLPLPDGALPPVDLVLSNSLLHHLHDPAVLFTEARRWGRPGAGVCVMDLMRPDAPADAAALVERYASDEPEVLRRDFYNSLRAALSPEEVTQILHDLGLASLRVRVVSDRHMVVSGRL